LIHLGHRRPKYHGFAARATFKTRLPLVAQCDSEIGIGDLCLFLAARQEV
jgi:hypothetical protein